MSKDGTQPTHALKVSPTPAASQFTTLDHNEYTPPHLTKADLDDSLSTIYDKLARKFQAELHKSTSTLMQEIAALGGPQTC